MTTTVLTRLLSRVVLVMLALRTLVMPPSWPGQSLLDGECGQALRRRSAYKGIAGLRRLALFVLALALFATTATVATAPPSIPSGGPSSRVAAHHSFGIYLSPDWRWRHVGVGGSSERIETYFVAANESAPAVWVHNVCGLERIGPARVTFEGREVRAVRSLGHLSENEVRYGLENGVSPRAPGGGGKLILHHHQQDAAGPIIEMPAKYHSLSNPRQHPLGSSGRVGNGAERAAFGEWRERYWKARYGEELERRGLTK